MVWQTWNRRLSKIPSDLAFTVHEAKTLFPFFLPNSFYNNPAANLFSACHSLSEAVSLLHLNPCFLSFCVILCFWVTSQRDRKRESFLRKEDCLSRPIIFCYIGSWTLCVRVCARLTFFSRSGSLKVSRNFLTCSERRRSMLRASMARPRNSSTSSSGFRFSCVFLKIKCLNKTRGDWLTFTFHAESTKTVWLYCS